VSTLEVVAVEERWRWFRRSRGTLPSLPVTFRHRRNARQRSSLLVATAAGSLAGQCQVRGVPSKSFFIRTRSDRRWSGVKPWVRLISGAGTLSVSCCESLDLCFSIVYISAYFDVCMILWRVIIFVTIIYAYLWRLLQFTPVCAKRCTVVYSLLHR